MKGGVNIWVALRDTRDLHRAWAGVERPYREEDMPRRINEARAPAPLLFDAAARPHALCAFACVAFGARSLAHKHTRTRVS